MNITYGDEICKLANRINLNLMYFGSAKILNNWEGSVTSPDYSRLYFITSGSAIIQNSETKLTLTPGKWYFLPSGFSFDFKFPKNMEHIYFHFKLCDIDEIDLLRFTRKPYILKNHEEISKILSLITSTSVTDAIFIKQFIYKLIAPITENISVKDYSPCVLRALQYIKSNLFVGITIEDIAAAAYTSKSTLTKKFRKELRMSVNEYVSDTILSDAARRLITKNESILSISERYGFSDQFYFSRKFKQKFGMSPRAYRKDVLL